MAHDLLLLYLRTEQILIVLFDYLEVIFKK